MGSHRYKLRDFLAAQRLVDLRKRTRLTQEEVAQQVGVSSKALRNWEGGSHYPSEANFQRLLAFYLQHHAFPPHQEQEQARALWSQLAASRRQPMSHFDEQWFAQLLSRLQPPSATQSLPAPVPAPGESRPPAVDAALPGVAPPTAQRLRGDWRGPLDVTQWYGRSQELAELERWVLSDHCRLVTILGIGGIGKTSLTVKLTQRLAPQVEGILWCSLYNAPHLHEVLQDWLPILSQQQIGAVPPNLEQAIALLQDCLQQRRYVLVLDNLETLLQEGGYRPGYEGYARLIRQVAQTNHQSCLLLTSRELWPELGVLSGSQSPVRLLRVPGLEQEACQQLLQEKELYGEQAAWSELVQGYGGNPLALKIVAETVRELFGGDIAAFVEQGVLTFRGIRELLAQQFERLAPLEQGLLSWLAIERELCSLEALRADVWPAVSPSQLIEALQSLRNRSLVERGRQGAVFTLQPVVLEYVSERLVNRVSHELEECQPSLLLSHALLQGQAREYVRASQARLLVQPVLAWLLARLGSRQRVQERLQELLDLVRRLPRGQQGYGGGNAVNLLVGLQGHVRGQDCSQLVIWQADLQQAEAQDASFVGADLTGSVFLERLEGIVPSALRPDGQLVAAGTFTGDIQVWQTATGQPLMTLHGHALVVWVLAFHPQENWLVSAGFDGLIKVWDLASGGCLRTLQAHTKWIRSIAVHPAGKWLASCGDDGTIKVWELSSGQGVELWHEPDDAVGAVAFSPDGRLLASGHLDGRVRLWAVESWQCLGSSPAQHRAGVASLAFRADSQMLASGGFDSLILLWQVQEGSLSLLQTLSGHTQAVYALAFHPEGFLASGGYDCTIKLWQIGEPGEAAHCLSTLHEHVSPVFSLGFGPQRLLVSSSVDSSVKLWQVSEGGQDVRCLRTLRGYSCVVNALAFSPDGRLLVSSENNGTIRRWAPSSGQCLSTLPHQAAGSFPLAFSPDGRYFAGSTPEYAIKVWRASSGQLAQTLREHQEFLLAVAFNPDGQLLASGGLDTVIRLWEVESGQRLRTLQGHRTWVWSLAFSPDRRLLASGDSSGVIKLWEISSGACLSTFHHNPFAVPALAFSPDGHTLLACHERELVSMWDVKRGVCLRTIEGIEGIYWVQKASFSPDGRLLAASQDQIVRVWDTGTGDLLRSLPCPAGQPWSVAWSADQRWLASGTDEGTILIWDWQTGQCQRTLRSERPYERMKISGITGITQAQKDALCNLGAIEEEDPT